MEKLVQITPRIILLMPGESKIKQWLKKLKSWFYSVPILKSSGVDYRNLLQNHLVELGWNCSWLYKTETFRQLMPPPQAREILLRQPSKYEYGLRWQLKDKEGQMQTITMLTMLKADEVTFVYYRSSIVENGLHLCLE